MVNYLHLFIFNVLRFYLAIKLMKENPFKY